ncbi:BON domain-containing protein [bacterium]|nr:BON domain-containing protein [bacterium]
MRIALSILLFCLVLACASGCDLMAKSKLEGAVLKALKDDPRTSQYSFEVSLQENGVVLITGEILKDEDKAAISEIAEAVPGVQSVMNNCAVAEPPSDMMQDPVVNTPYL